ncbi:MAG TPA: preprotein translocase subunit YajC [Longimicrobiales bacterium]
MNGMNFLALLMPAPQGGSSGGLVFLGEMVLIMAIFYFLIIAPQRKAQKKHQQTLAAVKKGDEVMTEGGIIGQVIFAQEDRLTIRTAENTRIVVARAKINRVLSVEGPAEEGK